MTPCREIQGAVTSGGYGRITVDGERYLMHRWVVAQIDGWDAIKGKVVRHACDNPRCFRYDHLIIGTHADNVADRVARGRSRGGGGRPRRETCRNGGHPIIENKWRRWCPTCAEIARKRKENR